MAATYKEIVDVLDASRGPYAFDLNQMNTSIRGLYFDAGMIEAFYEALQPSVSNKALEQASQTSVSNKCLKEKYKHESVLR